MAPDDVPPDEMRWFRSRPDPIDAVLGDDLLDEDLTDVAAIVHELRSAYATEQPLRQSPELAAFTQAPLHDKGDLPVTAGSNAHGSAPQMAGLPNLRERLGRSRTKMVSKMSAFVATVTGKVVLGAAVAAAGVGGLHAAEVVDVPVLPEQANRGAEEIETVDTDEVTTDDVSTDDVAADSVPPEVAEFVAAIQAWASEWADCVSTNASAQGDEETRVTEGFDPRTGCPDRPEAPFGPDNLPDAASEQGQANAEEGQANAEEGQANAEEGQANAEEGQANAEGGEANAGAGPESSDDNPSSDVAPEGTPPAGS